MVRVRVLGGLELETDGSPLSLPERRPARELLAWLALHPGTHSRSELAGRLWPDVLESSARTSLRTALVALRRALMPAGEGLVVTTRDEVRLGADANLWVDVRAFEELVREDRLDEAVQLSRGPLLTGLDADWVLEARDAHRDRVTRVLATLSSRAEAAGELGDAVRWARRRTVLDPLSEQAERDLIRCLAASGDRAAALVEYERLAERMRHELRMAPSAATRKLAEDIRSEAGPFEQAALHPLPGPLRLPQSSPFVGRDGELTRLRELWAKAPDTGRATAFVAGEAGIGKTRIAAELARSLHERGALVLYGRCDDGLAVPYQPFGAALRPLAHALKAARLRIELGRLAPELGRLVPELEGLGEPLRADPGTERFALFEAVAALAEAATRHQRALLVLDDLHWATNPTLLLLRHLIRCDRALDLLVLGTYREAELDDSHPLVGLLAELPRDSGAARIGVEGLDEGAVADLLEAAGHRLDEEGAELARALRTETGGNPLFIRELLAYMVESGTIYRQRGRWAADRRLGELALPDSLKEVIRDRIGRLSDAAARTLGTAAVAGQTFSRAIIEHVHGAPAELLDGLDEAVAAGLLAETGPAEYAFTHAVVRHAIYDRLGSATRMRIHRRIGEALEATGQADARPEAVAHHFAEAAADGQAAKAATYALAAARSATARLGYEEAASHCERGLEALALGADPRDEQRCELLLALVEARWSAGEMEASREAAREAAEVAERLGDSAQLVRAALGFAGPPRFEVAVAAAQPAVVLLERALRALDDGESALRARALGRLAAALAFSGQDERREALAREALEVGRRSGDVSALADALATSYFAARGPDNLRERLETATELARRAGERGEGRLTALARYWTCTDLLELGEAEASDRELAELSALADTLRERYPRWLVATAQARRAHLDGRIEEYERLVHDGLSLGLEAGEAATHVFGGQLLALRREQGRLQELVEATESFVAQYPEVAAWRCALAYVYVQLDREADARRQLETLARTGFSELPSDVLWLVSVSSLCEVVAQLDDAQRAESLYALLLPYADRCVVGDSAPSQGSASRPLGLLATTMSRFEDAERHFEDALAMNTRIGARLWLAHTQEAYARMLLRRGERGDRERAELVRGKALDTARELGLTALANRAGAAPQSAAAVSR